MGKIGQHSSNFIDMTGWKMWEHGISDSRLIIIKQAPIKKRKRLIGYVNVLVVIRHILL